MRAAAIFRCSSHLLSGIRAPCSAWAMPVMERMNCEALLELTCDDVSLLQDEDEEEEEAAPVRRFGTQVVTKCVLEPWRGLSSFCFA